MTPLDGARQMIRYALEEEACWMRLHTIVEEERARAYPEVKLIRRVFYGGPRDRRKGRAA